MHFRAARRPFISWGDSSSTHACAVAMRAFFYFEKSWLHLYYLAGGGIVSGPVQTWRKKNISFMIFYIFLSCHLFNLSKKNFFPHITNKKVQSVTWNCFQTSQTKDFSSCYKYYQTVSTFNVWTEKKKVS